MEVKKSPKLKIIKFAKKKIKCPNCKKESLEPFGPFCSKQCSDLDLLKWISDERYINLE